MSQEHWIGNGLAAPAPRPHGADATVVSLVKPSQPVASVVSVHREERPFMRRAREATRLALLDDDATVRSIARRLAVSGRTLQRRLQENGTTLQKLIASVRCDLAKEMLARPSITLVEIAKTLRFSAPSAFHRAFKRWTGQTPGDYRRAHQQSGVWGEVQGSAVSPAPSSFGSPFGGSSIG